MLGLNPTLVKALKEAFSITDPTPIQSEAIPHLLSSSECSSVGDVVMQAQTGSGKTLAYALPLLDLILSKYNPNTTPTPEYREEVGTVGLVIVPTRELAAQTQATLTKLLSRVRPHWIVTTALTGGDSRKSEKARLRRGCQIVVGTPGRLLDHLKTSEGWKRSKLAWLVVDEADRLADLGFENTVKDIFSTLSMALHRIRLVLVSATVTEKLKSEFAGRKLKSPKFIKAGPKKEIYQENQDEEEKEEQEQDVKIDNSIITNLNINTTTTTTTITTNNIVEFSAPVVIDQMYLHTPTKLRLQILVGLLRSFFPSETASSSCRVIVFFSCCDSVDFHYDLFRAAGENKNIPAFLPACVKLLRLHGNLDQSTRIATFNEFIKEGKISASSAPVQTVLFCTDVAARGLDFPNLAGSVQYDAPCDIHDYIHRAGRTGRLGGSLNKSKSIIFLMPSEEAYIQRLQSMGMSSLRKESFDEHLKWVDKLDASKLQSLLAKNNNKNKNKNNKNKNKNKKAENDNEEEEDPSTAETIAALPSTLKARLNLLQKVIEFGILADEELTNRARNAFLSTCRAYATHPSAEKDIFHIKRLHLGHLAAAFGLDREPKKMVPQGDKKRSYSGSADTQRIPDEIVQGSSKMRKEMRDSRKFTSQNFNYEQNHHQQHQNALSFNKKPPTYKNDKNTLNNKKNLINSNHDADDDADDDEKVTFAY